MCISANAAGNNVSAQNQLDINKYVQIFKGEDSKVKVLFVGNSITRHAPKADIGWSGDWGMAASCREKDYVHLVVSALDKRYNGVDYCIAQAALWEVNYFDGDKVLNEYYTAARDFDADIVIIRIGENINRDKNKEIPCKPYFADMIKFFAKNPSAQVIVTDNFWKVEALDKAFSEVIAENGYTYCHIGDLEDDEKTMAFGQFEHHGVCLHPSDYGMKCIADRIIKEVRYEKI